MPVDIFTLMGQVSVQTGGSEAALRRVDIAANQTAANLNKASGEARKAGGGFDELKNKLNSLSSIGSKMSLGITAPLVALGTLATSTAVRLDALKRGLTAITGSAGETAKQLERLKEVGKNPGVGYEEALRGSVNLQAAGMSAMEAERSIKAFGNALASVGKGKQELGDVLHVLGRMTAIGKVTEREIMELSGHVPQLRQIMISAFGTADNEILAKAGITGKEFAKLTTEALEKIPAALDSPLNKLENFDDVRKRVFEQFGDAILRILVPALDKITPIIEDIGNGFAALSPYIQTSIVIFGGVVAAIGPVLVVTAKVVGAFTFLAETFGVTGGAIAGLSNPIGWVVLALAAIAAAAFGLYKAWQNNWGGIRDTTYRVIASVKAAIQPALNSIKAWWDEHGASVLETLTTTWEAIKGIFKGGFEFIINLLAGIIQAIVGDWDGAMKSFGLASNGAVDAIKAAFGGLTDLSPMMNDIGGNLGKALGDKFKEMFASDIEDVKALWNGAKNLFGLGTTAATAKPATAAPKAVAPAAFNNIPIPVATAASAQAITVDSVYKKQFEAARQESFAAGFEKASKQTGISKDILMGVASRETNMKNIIGDHGHGVGVMQIDTGTDPAFKASGAWKDASAAIVRGAEILKEKFDWLTKNAGKEVSIKDRQGKAYKFTVPTLEGEDKTKTALAMYNSGAWAAYHASKGRSVDTGTTGGDYSADVMKRAADFKALSGGAVPGNTGQNTFAAHAQKSAAEVQKINATLRDTQPIMNQINGGFDKVSVSAHKLETEVKPLPTTIQKSTEQATGLAASLGSAADIAAKLEQTMARARAQELSKELEKIQNELKGFGENKDIKGQLAQLEGIRDLKKADDDAYSSMIRNRIKLADATVFHAQQANAAVLDFLATETKSITQIVSDAKIGVMKTAFDGIKSGFDEMTKHLGPFKGVVSQILTDLSKLALSKVFQMIFGGQAPGFGNSGAGAATGGGGAASVVSGIAQSVLSPKSAASGNAAATGGASAGSGIMDSAIKAAGGGGGGAGLGDLGIGQEGGGSGGGAVSTIGNVAQSVLGGGGQGQGNGPSVGGAVDMAQSVLGGGEGGGLGGMLGKVPMLAKAGGFLKGLPGIGGALGKLGGLFGMGGGGAAAGAAGAAGEVAGAAGGAMGAMSGIMAAAGPIGMIASVALPFMQMMSKSKIGRILSPGAAIIHAFTHDYEADFKKLIKGEYGINASKQMIAKVMQIGQSKFGPEDWKKREIETVRLPEVRNMLSEYSDAFSKGGNKKLFDSRAISDQFNAANRFQVKMLSGGIVPGPTRGYDHVPVLMDGGEGVIPANRMRGARGVGSGQSVSTELIQEHSDLMREVRNYLSRLQAASSEDWIRMAADKHPDAFMEAANTSAGRSSSASREFKDRMNGVR